MERRVPVVDRTDCFRKDNWAWEVFSSGEACPTFDHPGLQHHILRTQLGGNLDRVRTEQLSDGWKVGSGALHPPAYPAQAKARGQVLASLTLSWFRVRQIEQPGPVKQDSVGSMFHRIDLLCLPDTAVNKRLLSGPEGMEAGGTVSHASPARGGKQAAKLAGILRYAGVPSGQPHATLKTGRVSPTALCAGIWKCKPRCGNTAGLCVVSKIFGRTGK